jgi:hypothetical protein
MDSLGDIECGGGVCDVISKLYLHIRENNKQERAALWSTWKIPCACLDVTIVYVHVKHNKQAESKYIKRAKKKLKAQTTWMEDFCITNQFLN